jgi:hypothetical protein
VGTHCSSFLLSFSLRYNAPSLCLFPASKTLHLLPNPIKISFIMHFFTSLLISIALLTNPATSHATNCNTTSYATSLNITAISATNNASRLECWQLDAPPNLARAAVNFALGNTTNAFVGIIPPNTTTCTNSNVDVVQYASPPSSPLSLFPPAILTVNTGTPSSYPASHTFPHLISDYRRI